MRDESVRLGLSLFESKVLSELAGEGKTIFSIEDLTKKIESKIKARKMASSLVRKKWLERLKKGTYLILELAAGSKPKWSEDPFYIASKLAKPYYIGFLSMLNHYGWTEQVPTTVTIATTKPIKEKKILGVKYEFITLSKKKFFGYHEININGHKILVSDPEKTLVDAFDHPEYCGGVDELIKTLLNAENIDWEKVLEYAEKLGNGAVFKRLGYLIEKTNAPIKKEIVEALRKKITKGYSPLYPNSGLKGKHNTKWNIIINANISKEKL